MYKTLDNLWGKMEKNDAGRDDGLTEEKSAPHDKTNQVVASQNTVKNNNELSDKTDRL